MGEDDDREQADAPPPEDEPVDDLDREGEPDPAPDDAEEDDLDLDREARLDPAPRNGDRSADSDAAPAHHRRSDQGKWRSWAWWALIITTIGVGWALVLATVFVVRNGDRTADLIALVEEGQQQREAASGEIQQSQEERQAALKSERQQAQTFRAQELAALADQAESNAQTRQAFVEAALAESRIDQADSESRKADAETGLAEAQTETEATKGNREPAAPTDALATLTLAIESLQAEIEHAGNGGRGECPEDDRSKPPDNEVGCTTGGVPVPPSQ